MANTRLNLPIGQLVDLRGKPIVGGKLYIYDTGTTNLATTYSDAALSVTNTNTNPLIADNYGMFGDVFAMSNTAYDVVYKTAADALIKQFNGNYINTNLDFSGNIDFQLNKGVNLVAATNPLDAVNKQQFDAALASGSGVIFWTKSYNALLAPNAEFIVAGISGAANTMFFANCWVGGSSSNNGISIFGTGWNGETVPAIPDVGIAFTSDSHNWASPTANKLLIGRELAGNKLVFKNTTAFTMNLTVFRTY
jgi:hypothetical protein